MRLMPARSLATLAACCAAALVWQNCDGKTSFEEMLAILKRRLASNRESELREAAEQQRQITQIRLGKWLIE